MLSAVSFVRQSEVFPKALLRRFPDNFSMGNAAWKRYSLASESTCPLRTVRRFVRSEAVQPRIYRSVYGIPPLRCPIHCSLLHLSLDCQAFVLALLPEAQF